MHLIWQGKPIHVGSFEAGARNQITDVPGVLVGHKTYDREEIQTGLTAICLPHMPFQKYEAASYVFNGFGKSVGLMQMNELGEIETPMVLTNTYSVGACMTGLIEAMCGQDPTRGREKSTVNPVVFECNDGYLNHIQQMIITPQDVKEVLSLAREDFEEGSVGAGRGMSAYQLKGGIGSASRILRMGEKSYTVGVLSLTNMGLLRHFQFLGALLAPEDRKKGQDKGSMINILATDLPLSHRQLMRISKRCAIGLAHTGTRFSNGSGDIFTSVSTAIPKADGPFWVKKSLDHRWMDEVFEAAIDCTEEAILSSMLQATTVTGRDGHVKRALRDEMEHLYRPGFTDVEKK